jgi:multiple sugar transport system substrate-binding protein
MYKETKASVLPEVTRRQFLTGAATTAAALGLPMNRLLRPLVNVGPQKGAPADDVLYVALYDTAAAAKKAQTFVSTFTKQFGIKLNLIGIPANSWVGLFQSVSTRLAGGQPLDTAYIATEGMLLFEEKGVLDPLDPYITKDKAAVDSYYSDINPHMLAGFRELDNIHGHTFFLPIGYNVMSMWINKPVFKQHNVPLPSPDWTWDDFGKAAAKIASPPNRYGFAIGTPVPGPFTDIYPWVLTAGGKIMNNVHQTKCVADNPAAVHAATFVRSLVEKKLVNEPGGSYSPFTEAAGLKLGMFGGGIWPNEDLPLSQKQINEQFMIVPWPKLTVPGTPVGVGGFPVFKSSKAKPALWEFIKWTISDEFQYGPVVPFGGDMPIRRSVGTSAKFLKNYPPGTDYFVSELSYTTSTPGVPNASAVENEMSTAWEQILTGAISPAAGMKLMQDRCNSLMAQSV